MIDPDREFRRPGLYNTQRINQARNYFRRWDTDWLKRKRLRMICRLLGLEQVLTERAEPALPEAMIEALRVWTTPPREE